MNLRNTYLEFYGKKIYVNANNQEVFLEDVRKTVINDFYLCAKQTKSFESPLKFDE